MLRVCIDTNVWISGLLFHGSPAKVVDLAMKRKFHTILSQQILDELDRNLIKLGVTSKATQRLIDRITEISDIYKPSGQVKIIENNKGDNLVLETAWMGDAKYLVTGDKKHMLPLKSFKNVQIVSPKNLLEIIGL
jgi:putative PIN family toxin of toxin-antitoxin system